MSKKGITLTATKTKKRVPLKVQRKVGKVALQQVGEVVVVRTFFGTFIGRLTAIDTFTITLVVFSGFNRTFIPIFISRAIILDLFPFPLTTTPTPMRRLKGR